MGTQPQRLMGRMARNAMSSKQATMTWRLVAIAVVLALVGACTAPVALPAGEAASADLPAVPRARTLIVMAGPANQYTQFNNHNPFSPDAYDAFHVGTLPAMVEPLIMFNVLTGEHENWLAERWEYNDDFTAITLKLRAGIKWDDGEPFTADDVVYSFNMMRDNAAGMVHLADLPAFLQEAVKVDDLTVRLLLKRPNPAFWATTLTTNHSPVIVPKHIWADKNPLEFTNFDLAAGLPVGSGPFKLVAASPQQKVYDRRTDWWAVATGFKPLPNVERIIYLPQQEESQAAQMMITNQLDMGPIMQVPTLKAVLAQNPKITMFTGQAAPYGYLDWCPTELNLNASEPPYDDKAIRWALNYAIDRAKLVGLAEAGAGVPALHPFVPYPWFQPFAAALQEIFAKYEYDTAAHLDKVDAIMTGKGYTKNADGLWADSRGATFAINIYIPDWLRPYGPPLIQQLRDAGFDATFDTSPGLASAVQTGEQRAALVCKGPSGVRGMDPYFMLSIYMAQYFRPTGEPAANWWATSRWQNAEYDALVEQLALLRPADPQTMTLFKQAMNIWVSELPDIFVAQLIIRYPMNTTYWTNWPTQDNVYGFPHSWQHDFMLTFINLQPTQ
ncbi:MAG: ABC transporter substrate-binding protein [Caldilinea sp. CFX5]|nr:ABC transporter substrate-binding protein [Caldilinea sp. CFX5]